MTPIDFLTRHAPLFDGVTWAIGGSTLLARLGLEVSPRDLDLVVTEADFDTLYQRLAGVAQDQKLAPHPQFCTRRFARFACADGLEIDLMAGLGLRLEGGAFHWPFDAAARDVHDGLPWCYAEDWALLYRLMGRDTRRAQLDGYLARHGLQRPDRVAANLFAGYPDSALRPPPAWWPWDE